MNNLGITGHMSLLGVNWELDLKKLDLKSAALWALSASTA
jgi:hypothetical protein